MQKYFKKYSHLFEGTDLALNENTIRIADDITESLRSYLQSKKPASVLLVEDTNTRKAMGYKAEKILEDIGLSFSVFCFPDSGEDLLPSDKNLDLLKVRVKKGQLIMAVGSGTLNDLSRYTAFKAGLELLSIGTAPSMDGYASSVCPLIIGNYKSALPAKTASAVFAEIPVIAAAPRKMVSAGIGDLIGKFTARLDWELAGIYTEESVNCNLTAMIETELNDYFKEFQDDFFSGSSCRSLLKLLILSGLAIAVHGDSRPASGSEHIVGHVMEMLGHWGITRHYLHGEAVALGTWVIISLYEKVIGMELNEILKFKKNDLPSRPEILKTVFPGYAEKYIKAKKEKEGKKEVLSRKILQSPGLWDEYRKSQTIDSTYLNNLAAIYKKAEIPLNLSEYGLTKKEMINIVIGAEATRDRFTILEFLDAAGCLEGAVSWIIDQLF